MVLVSEQGDVFVEAECPQRYSKLDPGLAGADDQEPRARWSALLRDEGVSCLLHCFRAHGYTWVSGVVTNSSTASVSRSWQDSRELSSRSTAVP
ncbi:hypothetical protein SRABI128_05802 [Microbacterium sp. Bi128]|nr:hypothetical protein SRABI128_05802 [Microbacterium sp. Bi128]